MLPLRSSLPDPAQAEPCLPSGSAPLSCAGTLVNDTAPAQVSAATNDNAGPADVQKRPRGSSRVSPLADRQFINEFKGLTGIDQFAAPAQPGVRSIVSHSKGLSPSDPLPAYITKSPRPWRDATDETKGFFAFQALEESGPAVAFTVWCSPEIDAKARATGAPLVWLHRRLKKALDAVLGPVEWLAGLEEEKAADGKLLLHLHGAGAFGDLTRSRRAKIRKAMRRALGSWEGPATQFQVKLGVARDAGWASYCTKRAWLSLPGIRERFACAGPRSPWCVSFDGPVLTMTNGVRARGKELHQGAREIVQEARRRVRSAASPTTTPTPPTAADEAAKLTPPQARAWATRKSVGTDLLDEPVRPGLAARTQPTTTARSRGPPGPGPGASAGPDPPLPKRHLVGQVAEHELAPLAIAERDDGRAGHEARRPRRARGRRTGTG